MQLRLAAALQHVLPSAPDTVVLFLSLQDAAAADGADESSMTVEKKLLADAERLAASIQVGRYLDMQLRQQQSVEAHAAQYINKATGALEDCRLAQGCTADIALLVLEEGMCLSSNCKLAAHGIVLLYLLQVSCHAGAAATCIFLLSLLCCAVLCRPQLRPASSSCETIGASRGVHCRPLCMADCSSCC